MERGSQQPAQATPAGYGGAVAVDQANDDQAAASTTSQNQKKAPEKRKVNSTQNSLLISEIRDNMVIMGDGSFRAVIACKSINFDLMSSQEREGVEYSYQNFINSLTFPAQILIRSQRIDIGPYLDRLDGLRRAQENMLLDVLIEDYIKFIDILSQEANIMDKRFFVIVPYSAGGDMASVVNESKGVFSKIFGSNRAASTTKIDKIAYQKIKDELHSRVDLVLSGINQVGVQAVQLTTKELGELYYSVYNPDTAVREPLGDFTSITASYVRRAGPPLAPPLETPEQQLQPVAQPQPVAPEAPTIGERV